MRDQSLMLVLALSTLGGCTFHALAPSEADDASPDGGAPEVDDGAPGSSSPGTGSGSGAVPVDAPPPVAPTITLSETTSDVISAGLGAICNNQGGRTSGDETWHRVFRPADFQVTGALQVTGVRFSSSIARNARGVQVRVGTYTGTLGADTLTPGAVHSIATAVVDVPDSQAPQSIAVPVDATIPAGALLVVQVAAPNLGTQDGVLYLGATAAGEIQPGYFSSDTCFKSLPQSEASLGVHGHVVIDVVAKRL